MTQDAWKAYTEAVALAKKAYEEAKCCKADKKETKL